MRAVASRIKAERIRQHKTTAGVALILGVPEQYIIDIEDGKTQLTMRGIDEIAVVLDVDADYLKFGDQWHNPHSISTSNIDNPRFNNSDVTTNTATTMTTNHYYSTGTDMQDQINRIEQAAHAGRLGAVTRLDKIEEQIKLLLERTEHINHKIDDLVKSN